MNLIRPNILTRFLSIIYGGVNEGRNYFFRKKIISSTSFPLHVISIGNLAVGGTGKTPHTEYILNLLKDDYTLAVLSRGYGRKTKGFIQADENTSANEIGDEPFQIHAKFPQVKVFVDEKRVHGVSEILHRYPQTNVILLDDAYQHQYIKPGLSILLTEYAKPFTRDAVMPYGRLREKRKNANRADIIVVTKCPLNINKDDIQMLRQEINAGKHQEIFFSGLEYDNFYQAFDNCNVDAEKLKNQDVIILSGIENPEPMIKYVEKLVKSVEKIIFDDHHFFSVKEIENIEKKMGNKLIITTEKDMARLKSVPYLSKNLSERLLVLPMKIKILDDKEDLFNLKMKNYVRKNSTNR